MNPASYLNQLLSFCADADNGDPRYLRYYLPINELSEGLPVPILGIHLLIWQIRVHDLQNRYLLRTLEDRRRFLSWSVVHGQREYIALREASQFWDALKQKACIDAGSNDVNDYGNAISWLMVFSVVERDDLDFDLSTPLGREQLCAWYLLNGRRELDHEWMTLAPWQIHYLLGPSTLPGINRLQLLVYRARPDVQAAFSLPAQKDDFIAWFRIYVSVETRLIDGLRTDAQQSLKSFSDFEDAKKPFGVNVIGHAFGQLGIGEDARMATKSLLAADVPVVLLDFSPGDEVDSSERCMEAHVGNEGIYPVNIFCLTALEHGRYFAEKGASNFSGRFNVGYWPWELSQWPDDWLHLFLLVDEVWVSSNHTLEALSAVSSVPIRLMPMAVDEPNASSIMRADLGLPVSKKLFLFVFDLNSSAKRKNPAACIAAFLEAFPQNGSVRKTESDVALVIKVHPPKQFNQEWEDLKALQRGDSRIFLLEKTLSKQELYSVYNSCDCFLSLHRAEGFGRCIAEVMLLEKPVIVTAYSGNMSFNSRDNSLLVRWMPKLLAEGDYPNGTGAVWAEPDVSHAAQRMRDVVSKPDITSQLARRGRETILRMHSPEVVGKRYREVLYQILPNR